MAHLTPRLASIFKDAYEKLRTGQLKTLIPFLSLFRLNGRPMNLQYHYQIAPLFNTVQPAHTVCMFARQLGKTWNVGGSLNLRSMLIPNYHVIIIQPRADQIQRMIGTTYRPMLASCPIREEFITNAELQKVSLREFNNHSLCYAEYSFLSPDRVRGVASIATAWEDEVQDIEYEFIPIINETMSASLFWGFAIYTGTPKTTDTTLALLWNKSSQAEWIIKCQHCGYFNVPNPDHDLLKMIGQEGPICAKCGKPIYPQHGGYVHAYPDRMHSFAGYHISQTIHPLHCLHANKWRQLMEKVNTYEPLQLFNEVLGWPYDAASSPLTMTDLQSATHDIQITKPADVQKIAGEYRYITVGVDWSGGGMISDSYTAYAVLGFRKDSDVIDVLYGKRIKKGMSPSDEAKEIMHWLVHTGADAFAYDNGGAGFTRMEIMKQMGIMSLSKLIIVPINYVAPRSGDVMRPHTGQREADLYYYSLDKSRSLAVCITALKSKRIRLPKFNEEDANAYQRDFLALREDPSQSARSETVILIKKKPGVPDDFAHAVNFGCSQIWDHFGAYPRIGSRYDTSILDIDDAGNAISDGLPLGPRGDFERFTDAVNLRATAFETEDGFYDNEY